MLDGKINLIWLRTFEAAARHLNFTDASVELGLTQTAVSLHIRSLESKLGRKLFLRRARHLKLTEIGQAYVPTVRQALADINLVTTSLFGPMTTNMITVRAPISTSTLWLAPRLPLFRQEFPEIDLRLVSSIWTESAHQEDVDVEIRLGRGDWPDAQSEKLSDESIVPICSRAHYKTITGVEDFLRGPLIHILGHEGNWPQYFAAQGLSTPVHMPQYYIDTTTAAMALVAANGGFATVIERLVHSRITGTAEFVIAGPPISFSQSHYLMHPTSKQATPPEVEIFENWLRRQFS
ncbi:LysR substrate-binding domain-containing protein [Cohaesibacter celericrescens]|uniref:LysR family transcriptional regulator n=1 Tax=Cohaesibacter celericrescens TaxID=2067669 RepID=A0A2N5XQ12_9HYPH|nr:LysR substrate-binding domain-containing protein [Cohaesibacter celericrescens]PLW76574.1 LysR family transcriptional regulator [Cohaesibacter celericrescens]